MHSFLGLRPVRAGSAEVFGGYSFLRAKRSPNPAAHKLNQDGWEASVTANLARSIGVEADFGNHYTPNANQFTPIGNRGKGFTFLFGPRYSYTIEERGQVPVRFFIHALFGGIRADKLLASSITVYGLQTTTRPETAFAAALGGGVDLEKFHRVWIRLVQVDYLRANLSAVPQNDLRVSVGVVVAIGKR